MTKVVHLILGTALCAVAGFAQQPGTNVNVLPSYPNGVFAPPFPPAITVNTDPLRGDGYLQRQVEPSIATSTYNPDHVLAAFGDYRTVSIPNDTGLPGTVADGWIGISRSYDRGKTWFGSLVPGFPQDTSAVGQSSPLYGLQAGSDSVIATTPGGHFYIGGLFFTRGGLSDVAVVHYRDVPDTDGGDTIRYQSAVVVDKGSNSENGNFVDKPAIAADIARGTTNPSVCGPVYIAYTIFTGSSSNNVFTSKVGFTRSKQGKCGASWDAPQYLHKNYKQNQGTSMVVDPNTGKIYVFWRHIYVPGGDGFPDGILMVTSTDSGSTFSAPTMITGANFAPFDQPNIPTTTDSNHPAFRSNAFPATAIDASGNIYVATQERIYASGGNYPPGYYEPRIVIRTSRNGGSSWTSGSVVDSGPASAQQFMPALNYAAGLLKLLWYDFREQNQLSDNIAGGWYVTGFDRQMKAYVAQSTLANVDARGNPVFAPSVPVSMYLTDPRSPNQSIITVPGTSIPAVNRPNLTMYSGGTTSFTGDYIGLMTVSPFVANPGGTSAFRWATKPTDYVALSSFGAWTDSRDVVFPTSTYGVPTLTDIQGWQQYAPPGTGTSCINPGSRNANVYASEIKPGVIAGSPALSRQLVDGSGNPIERAFPVYVENPNPTEKFFRLSFNPNTLVVGSFTQGTETGGNALTQVDVDILPYSSVSTTAFVYCSSCSSSNAFARFSVSVQEITQLGGTPTGANTTTVLFNNDPTAPFVINSNLAFAEIHNVSVSNPQYSNPQYSNPQYSNPQYSNPQYSNPQYSNPQYSNPQYSNIAPVNAPPVGDFVWTVQNAGNNTSAYTSLTNVATSGLGSNYTYEIIVARSYNFPAANGCNVQPIPLDQIISIIPNPQYSNPQYSNPQYSNPQYSNPQYSNATFAAAPPPSGSGTTSLLAATTTSGSTSTTSTDDGTTKMPRQPDTVYVVLRVYRTGGGTAPLSTTEQQAILSNASVIVYPQAPNTGTGAPTPQQLPPASSNKSFSTTTLSANPAASVFGQNVALMAVVAPQSPASGTPTGTVDFKEGTSILPGGQAVPLQNGQAQFNIASLAPGTHTVTAVYSGDTSFNFSISSQISVTVNQAATVTAVTSSANPSVWGQSVTISAAVTVVAPGAGNPTGTVTFFDASTPVASNVALSNGVASFTSSTLAVGSHPITATYTPDATSQINFTGSTSAVMTQVVNKAATTTSLVSSVNPSAFGQVITLTATTSVVAPGAGSPDGTITFYDGAIAIGSAPLCTAALSPCGTIGQAVISTGALSVGQHSLTAVYGGSSFFAGSTSSALTQTVVSTPGYATGFSGLAACGYAPVPDAPTLSYAADPSGVASTYKVIVSYLTPSGEYASGESSLAVPAGNLLVVSSPGAAPNVTDWNVYVSSGGAEVLQNATPLQIGQSWTEPSTGLVTSGPQPPALAPAGAPSTSGCIQLNGNAAAYGNTVLTSGASVLEMTQEVFGQASSAFYNVLQPVKQGFTTTFQFQVKDVDNFGASYPADGIAFVIQNANAGLAALGGGGGSMGYGPTSPANTAINGSIDNSIVVEFDTFQNTVIGDPNANHIAVQACGPGKQNSPAHTDNNQFGWPNCTVGQVATPQVTLADQAVHTVTISYTPPPPNAGGNGTLTVTLDNVQAVSVTLNLEGQMQLGGTNNDSAYLGFSSGTGALAEKMDVLNWTFSPNAPH